jgi:hypothetical protein
MLRHLSPCHLRWMLATIATTSRSAGCKSDHEVRQFCENELLLGCSQANMIQSSQAAMNYTEITSFHDLIYNKRGQQSAALLVVRAQAGFRGFNDRVIDLRVDDHPTPIEELQRRRSSQPARTGGVRRSSCRGVAPPGVPGMGQRPCAALFLCSALQTHGLWLLVPTSRSAS